MPPMYFLPIKESFLISMARVAVKTKALTDLFSLSARAFQICPSHFQMYTINYFEDQSTT